MKKKILIPLILVILALLGGLAYLFMNLEEQKQVNRDMQELAELDKQEMENEYERFALQYSEMKTQINNDSIVEQLTQEQMKTQKLLEELKKVKADDAREITRLKKELATVREVLRSYIIQVDSLNRLNESLKQENSRVNAVLQERNSQIAGLSSEKASLSEKVAIAAQLDATNISLSLLNKRDKPTKKLKDTKKMQVNYHKECDGFEWESYHLCAHPESWWQYAQWWWLIRLRKPQSGVFYEENHRVFR